MGLKKAGGSRVRRRPGKITTRAKKPPQNVRELVPQHTWIQLPESRYIVNSCGRSMGMRERMCVCVRRVYAYVGVEVCLFFFHGYVVSCLHITRDPERAS